MKDFNYILHNAHEFEFEDKNLLEKLVNNLSFPYDFSCYKKDDHFIFVDLGANVGLVSLWVAYNFPKAKIYAFEPSPSAFKKLQNNVNLLNFQNRIKIYNLAVHNGEELEFFDFETSYSRSNTFVKDYLAYETKNNPKINIIKIRTLKLNDVFSFINEDHIDYLKCDIEGSEHIIFNEENIHNTLKKINYLSLELHGQFLTQLILAQKLIKEFKNKDNKNICLEFWGTWKILKFNDDSIEYVKSELEKESKRKFQYLILEKRKGLLSFFYNSNFYSKLKFKKYIKVNNSFTFFYIIDPLNKLDIEKEFNKFETSVFLKYEIIRVSNLDSAIKKIKDFENDCNVKFIDVKK